MRRALDWIVVSLSMVVLAANWMLVSGNSLPPPALLRGEGLRAPSPPAPGDSPFAYIREDGTQVFLPADGRRTAVVTRLPASATRTAQPAQGRRVTPALYSWYSPASTVRDAPRLQ